MNSDASNSTPAPANVQPGSSLLNRFKLKLRSQYDSQLVSMANAHIDAIKKLDAAAELLARVPEHLIENCYFYGVGQLDFDNLSRDDALAVMRAMHAGQWTKSLNSSRPELIDYEATVDGFKIRLWAAGPPDSCRVIEYDEPVPATTIKRVRLVCKGDEEAQ